MDLEHHNYYHLYNRTNNKEKLFKESKNYLYFLRKFRDRFTDQLTVFAYCLMPTHFHFLIRVDTANIEHLKSHIGIFLGSYAKAINSAYNRNGSLFQKHTKTKHVDDLNYLMTLLTYIHQNPIRAGLADSLKEWPYSSYLDLAEFRSGTLADKSLVEDHFASVEDFRVFSNNTIKEIKDEYWIND